MEMTTDQVPQQEEEKGWYTIEEKIAFIEELEAFEAGGGRIDDFAKQKGMSVSAMHRYRKQVRGKKHGGKHDLETKFKEAKELIAGGLPIAEACRQAGITYPQFHYRKYKTGAKRRERVAQKYAPRKIKSLRLVDVPDDSYNKTLRARIVSLERLIVELTLDKQALMEAREGAI